MAVECVDTQLAYVSDVMMTAKEFPGILNCCIDVREAFTKEWTESTSGTGFDGRVRGRREIAHLTRINDDTSSREYECRSGIHLRELGSA